MAVMVSEGWMVVAKLGEAVDLNKPPSQSPYRREVIVLMGEEREGQQSKFLPIIRNDRGEFRGLGESEMPQVDAVKGRFTQFLPPHAPSAQERAMAENMLRAVGVKSVPVRPTSRPPKYHM